jgi:outer membrane protein OmpU
VGCWRCQLTDWFCGKHPLGNGLTAFAKGEFKVDIRDDGDFGDARKAYVGLEDFFV